MVGRPASGEAQTKTHSELTLYNPGGRESASEHVEHRRVLKSKGFPVVVDVSQWGEDIPFELGRS